MDIRKSLNIVRNYKNGNDIKFNVKENKNNKTVRDFLSITRKDNFKNKLFEVQEKKTTPFDQKNEENKIINYFDNYNVVFDFEPLKIYDNGIWWGGIINNVLQFTFTVGNDVEMNKLDIIELDEFDRELEDNKKIVELLKIYYDKFSEFWIDNHIQVNNK